MIPLSRFPHLRTCSLFLLAIAVLGLTTARTAGAAANNGDLENRYRDKVLALRQSYQGDHLQFDASGRLLSASTPGPWTLYGQVRVKEISLHGSEIRIRAQRMYLYYDHDSHQFRDLQSLSKDDNASRVFDMKAVGKWAKQKTSIEIESGASSPEMADIEKAMNAVFLAPGESLANAAPDYWKEYLNNPDAGVKPKFGALSSSGRPHNSSPEQENGIYRVGGGVKPPHATHSPDPEYSEIAREARYHGTCVLQLVAGRDGSPHDVRIVYPTGLGLDEKAVEAVRSWRFDPGTKDGEPVAVQIDVEVTFRLY